ncbi:MAG: tetratricopeptide repeat protein [Patescibacteria group bacterium]
MKLKIVIGVVILIVIIAGAWYMLKRVGTTQPINIDAQSDDLILRDTTNTTTSSTTQGSNNQTDIQSVTKDPALKILAMQIIAKPIVINATLTDAQKQNTIKQIEEIKKQITTNYDVELPWLMLGNYRKSVQDYDGAIEAWNFLATIRPKGYLAFHNLGSLYGFELRNYTKSEENFLKAIKNNASNIDAYSQLVAVYETYKPEKIEQLLLDGIKLNPNDASLKIMLGQYYAKIGNKIEAIKYFEEALKINPTNSEIKAEIEELKK